MIVGKSKRMNVQLNLAQIWTETVLVVKIQKVVLIVVGQMNVLNSIMMEQNLVMINVQASGIFAFVIKLIGFMVLVMNKIQLARVMIIGMDYFATFIVIQLKTVVETENVVTTANVSAILPGLARIVRFQMLQNVVN